MEKIMTIKDVEKELGIPRATIRFYEKHGLIYPNRSENSYRSYSHEDVAELRRIIILRKLGISVEEIASLLKGQSDLQKVLSINIEKLDAQLKELTGAINMCKKLEKDGTLLEELSQITYWTDMEKEEKKGNLFMSISEDFYIVAKHQFLSSFGLEDSEGNATNNRKGIIFTVFFHCLGYGIFMSVIMEMAVKKNAFSFTTFMEWFSLPFIFVIIGFFVELPFYFIGKKYPVLAKRLKRIGTYIVIGGMGILLAIGMCLFWMDKSGGM